MRKGCSKNFTLNMSLGLEQHHHQHHHHHRLLFEDAAWPALGKLQLYAMLMVVNKAKLPLILPYLLR